MKLRGDVHLDPQTGQIVTTLDGLPQTPFQKFTLHFFGSERGIFATPTQCGQYPVTAQFVPWDSALPDQSSTSFFTVDSGPGGSPCPPSPRAFTPAFQAGTVDNTAGSHSSFGLKLSRPDGDQNLAGLTVSTPPGFSATLKGVPFCPEVALAAAASPEASGLAEGSSPSCPVASLVGGSTTGAGAGTHPVYLSGKVYLAGPYKGAPLSLAVITPAVSGPYDLGNVVVRAALHVDPRTARVTAVSDPLPQILEGVPLRLRSILVNLNRPDFAINPTNCDPLSVDARLSGDQGSLVSLSEPFQVANCSDLSFAPGLSLRLTGGVHRLGHPAIHAVLTTRPGEANPSSISVTLPPSELLDNAHIRTICTRVDFARQACPAGSLLGHGEVTTPLLDQPLQGKAYLRSSDTGLPDLALDLNGQIHVEAVARIDAVNRGLRATFRTLPDVPLGTVALDLLGGSKGLIRNSEDLCGAHPKARVRMSGQNGKTIGRQVALQTVCGKGHKAGAKKHKRHRQHQPRSARVVG